MQQAGQGKVPPDLQMLGTLQKPLQRCRAPRAVWPPRKLQEHPLHLLIRTSCQACESLAWEEAAVCTGESVRYRSHSCAWASQMQSYHCESMSESSLPFCPLFVVCMTHVHGMKT